MGLGNQVGSTIDHLQLLPPQHTERSNNDEGRADYFLELKSGKPGDLLVEDL